MKRYTLTAVFAILCAVCVAKALPHVRMMFKPPDATFAGPGEFKFKAPESGEYTLWQESARALKVHLVGVGNFSIRGNVSVTTESKDSDKAPPAETTITVQQGTKSVPVTSYTGMTFSMGGAERKSVLLFPGTKGLEYTIAISGPPPPRTYYVTHGPLVKAVLMVVAWAIAACGTAALAVLFLVLALTGIFPKK